MAWQTQDRRKAEPDDKTYLDEEIRSELTQKYLPRYPTKRAALLPALHLVQHKHGWIAPRAMEELAVFLELAPADVLDTATFYEEYWLKPKGRHLIGVCRSLSCEICGSRSITDYLKTRLMIEPGQTTADGQFTLIEMECLGACGGAPAMLVDETLYENLTIESTETILRTVRQEDQPSEH